MVGRGGHSIWADVEHKKAMPKLNCPFNGFRVPLTLRVRPVPQNLHGQHRRPLRSGASCNTSASSTTLPGSSTTLLDASLALASHPGCNSARSYVTSEQAVDENQGCTGYVELRVGNGRILGNPHTPKFGHYS